MEIEYASEFVPTYDTEITEHSGNESDIDDDSEGIAALGLGSRNCSLEAEASVRMREVAQAVSAAESEEAAAAATGQLDDVAVPSIIRPGVYGDGSRSSIHKKTGSNINSGSIGGDKNSSSRDLAWRRMMYPAGRIMHLVPARLVPGLDWESRPATPAPDSEAGDGLGDDVFHGGVGGMDENDAWPEAVMEEGDDYPIPASPYPSFKRRSSEKDNNKNSINQEQDQKPSHSRHLSELSLKDLVSAEEAAGSAASGGAGNHGPLPPLKPPIGPPPEPMVLLDGVPQEAYGRIKLCRTVLSDHVIPNYLRSLASFLERL